MKLILSSADNSAFNSTRSPFMDNKPLMSRVKRLKNNLNVRLKNKQQIEKKSTPYYLSALSCALSNSFSRNSCSALTISNRWHQVDCNTLSQCDQKSSPVGLNKLQNWLLRRALVLPPFLLLIDLGSETSTDFCASPPFPAKPLCGFLSNEVIFNPSSLLWIPSFTVAVCLTLLQACYRNVFSWTWCFCISCSCDLSG